MKNSSPKLLSGLLLLLSVSIFSCEKDDPVPEIDQELITEMTLLFEEVDGTGAVVAGSAFEVVARDAQGISLGSTPQIEDISSLVPGKTYQLSITLYNDIAKEDMTGEIVAHGDEHQFYFLGSALVGDTASLGYTYLDQDADGYPLGLKGTVSVSDNVSMGSFRVVLRHGLNKAFSGADQPNFENYETAGGESDLDITFQVKFSS